MKRYVVLIAAALLPSAVCADSGIQRVPCGYQQITSLGTATKLTVPTTCNGAPAFAVITAEAQAVRYRDDGVAPTASVGMPVAIGAPLNYDGRLPAIQFIEQTSGAKLNISYYR